MATFDPRVGGHLLAHKRQSGRVSIRANHPASLVRHQRRYGRRISANVECLYETPDGLVPVITPGLGKRETLRRLKRCPVVQAYVREHWEALKGSLGDVLGYKRRRETSLTAIDHVNWLFRRHILHESTDAIAEESENHVMTVESSIKEFRRLLDLQPKNAVHCLEHRQRPWPI